MTEEIKVENKLQNLYKKLYKITSKIREIESGMCYDNYPTYNEIECIGDSLEDILKAINPDQKVPSIYAEIDYEDDVTDFVE